VNLHEHTSAQLDLNFEKLKNRFPGLKREVNGRQLTYLDTAATAMKLDSSINAQAEFYRMQDAPVHRGLYSSADGATTVYESIRDRLAEYLHAPSRESLIYTHGTTSALNMVAFGLEHTLSPGDEILLTHMEHHANLVPWLMLARRSGAVIHYLPLTAEGELDLSNLENFITSRTRVLSLTLVSNVLGTINPIERLAREAHKVGALVVVDAAQAAGHLELDFEALGCDFLALSAHKMYGPYGLGFLVGKSDALDSLQPLEGGGQMIERVRFDGVTFGKLPVKFEAGTPNPAAVAAMGPVLDFLSMLGPHRIRRHEQTLVDYALLQLRDFPDLQILGPLDSERRGGLVSFFDHRVHPHDMATLMDQLGIAVRAGHHCAEPLHDLLGIPASLRASFGIYSTRRDVDSLLEGIEFARRFV
jgi:cysteine desulfurase/selenocysteine lyase